MVVTDTAHPSSYEYEVKGERPDPSTASNEEEAVVLQILADVQDARGMRYWHQLQIGSGCIRGDL